MTMTLTLAPDVMALLGCQILKQQLFLPLFTILESFCIYYKLRQTNAKELNSIPIHIFMAVKPNLCPSLPFHVGCCLGVAG